MLSELGLVHIYCGDGKGKTTAAMGLAVRALGNGLRVIVAQFLKDGTSGELNIIRADPNAVVISNEGKSKFSFQMNEEEKAASTLMHTKTFEKCIKRCENGECDLLILDEILSAISTGMFDESMLIDFITTRGENARKTEIVITGRNPSDALVQLADYQSKIEKLKHPYDKGITARRGIEM